MNLGGLVERPTRPVRHPGTGLVLAGQHRRFRADPPGQADLREWNLARVVWVGDRGFTSATNRADLRGRDRPPLPREIQAMWSLLRIQQC